MSESTANDERPDRTRLSLLLILATLVLATCAFVASSWWGPADPDPRSRVGEETVHADVGRSAFRDVASQAGIDFRHHNGASGGFELWEIMSGGGGFLDHDGDGHLDVFLVQGCGDDGIHATCTSRLYRNRGDGSFVDVTAESGAGVGGHGMGVAAADSDGDGDVDLYVTRVGPDRLLRNDGDGTFTDATEEAGLGDPGFGSSAAFLDYDRDGSLDLYVARYTTRTTPGGGTCHDPVLGHRDYCNPTQHPAPSHLLYRNLGDGRFADVSLQSGIGAKTGYGLAVLCTDVDDDGWVDIYVANDQSPAFLWLNQGDGRFQESGVLSGCALSGDGMVIAGMGTVGEDFDGDDDLDLFVTNIRRRSHLFLRNTGGFFEDVSTRWGERSWLWPETGFGAVCLDQDLDGGLELFLANGSVSRLPEPQRPDAPYAERNVFLRWDGGRFVDASARLEPALLTPEVSRGLAYGDHDDDGDVDLLVCRNGAAPQLLRNEQASGGHWIGFHVVERDGATLALNARVRVEAGDLARVREVRTQQSYLATHDPRLHFGIGSSTSVERVSVRWADGSCEVWRDLTPDRYVTLRRGEGQAGAWR